MLSLTSMTKTRVFILLLFFVFDRHTQHSFRNFFFIYIYIIAFRLNTLFYKYRGFRFIPPPRRIAQSLLSSYTILLTTTVYDLNDRIHVYRARGNYHWIRIFSFNGPPPLSPTTKKIAEQTCFDASRNNVRCRDRVRRKKKKKKMRRRNTAITYRKHVSSIIGKDEIFIKSYQKKRKKKYPFCTRSIMLRLNQK